MPNKVLGKLFFSIALVLSLFSAHGQASDSAKIAAHQKDSLKKKAFRDKYAYPSPRVAMLCSAVIPGLGQAYNKKYWKVPIVYAGLGAMAYFIVSNQQQYTIYYNALKNPNPANQINQIYTLDDLSTIENYYSRNRNLSIIGAAFIYMLNIVDANVDAQLHKFDVSDNLSLHFSPIMSPSPTGGLNFQPGFSLAMKF